MGSLSSPIFFLLCSLPLRPCNFPPAFAPIPLRMPGERRGLVPPKFRPAPVTTKQVPIGPSLSHSHSFIGGRPGDGIAVGIIHSRRIPLPPLPMISAAIAGMQQLMGQGLPAAHFRSLRHPPGHFDTKTPRFPIKNAAAKPGSRPGIDDHMGFYLLRNRDPQCHSLGRHFPQKGIAVIQAPSLPSARICSSKSVK